MSIDEFDWDNTKAADNFRKHGVSFEEAAHALGDLLAIENLDDRFDYGEPRTIATAMGKDQLLSIVYTERGNVIRIISARRATRDEQDDYYRQNAAGPDAGPKN
jgi:uncharacterized DUF497 family protein